MELEEELVAEHILTVRDGAGEVVSAMGLYGTEPVVATARGGEQLHLHRPFCRAHEVRLRCMGCCYTVQYMHHPP